MEETYEFSKAVLKARVRKHRLREGIKTIPAAVLTVLFAGMYVENPITMEAANAIIDHWRPIVGGALFIGLFGVYFSAMRDLR